MGTLEEDNEISDIRTKQHKSWTENEWLYIIGFLMLFFLIGSCVKWLSAIFHGLH
jgi:hypothetical protein